MIPIIDTHQHLLDPLRWPYSWTKGFAALEEKPFTDDNYQKEIEGTGIVASIFMESTPDEPYWHSEALWVESLSKQKGSVIQGLISNCRPEEKNGFENWLEENVNPFLKGLRRFLHVVPDELSQSDHFFSNLQLLEKYHLPFDLCIFERQFFLAENLVRSTPSVQFVLDHCGVPEMAGEPTIRWRQGIQTLASYPNVACKLSGLLAYCPAEKVNMRHILPYVEHVITSFGWNRMLWGSDWPVVTMTSSIRQWVSISRDLLSTESESNQHKLFHLNAERIYKLQSVPSVAGSCAFEKTS